jgi:hypothetical protein
MLGSPNARQTIAVTPRWGDTSANRALALKAIRKIQASGITSANGIARELTSRKLPTLTGGKVWSAAQVQRLLQAQTASSRTK